MLKTQYVLLICDWLIDLLIDWLVINLTAYRQHWKFCWLIHPYKDNITWPLLRVHNTLILYNENMTYLHLFQRDVTYEEAKQFAEENGLMFVEARWDCNNVCNGQVRVSWYFWSPGKSVMKFLEARWDFCYVCGGQVRVSSFRQVSFCFVWGVCFCH
jgi:hypothetical protein